MIKKVINLAIVGIFLSTGISLADTIKISNNNTPVQKESGNSQIIYLLPEGTEVEKISSVNGMYEIRYWLTGDVSVKGWISSSNVEGSQFDTGVLNSYGRIYDYVVKTDAPGSMPVVTDWMTLQKILDTYSGKNSGNYLLNKESICKALIACQEQYNINALYLAASAIWTSGGGRSMKYTNNILNNGTGTFSSPEECIMSVGRLLQNKYYNEGRITIRQIRQKWNSDAGDIRALEIARQMCVFIEKGINNGYITDQTFIEKYNTIYNRTLNKNRTSL